MIKRKPRTMPTKISKSSSKPKRKPTISVFLPKLAETRTLTSRILSRKLRLKLRATRTSATSSERRRKSLTYLWMILSNFLKP